MSVKFSSLCLSILLLPAAVNALPAWNTETEELANSSVDITFTALPAIEIPQTFHEHQANIWDDIGRRLYFPIPDQKRIQQALSWYKRHPGYIERVTHRASPYLYHIVSELRERNMPMELALLPIVESAFNPFAYSHGRAAGIWQFIPGTGKRFGLKQNWWYDGRRDIIESTRAALDYLSYLYRLFDGNWLHAIAAYNSGEGNVRKAIRRNKKRGKSTDFFSLKLPKETEAYVPKLLALSELLKNAELYGINWPAIANEPAIAVVGTERQIDLARAAAYAGLELDTIYQLNPGFNRWATDPNGPHQLVLPLDKVTQFKTNLDADKSGHVKWIRYKIRQGDSLIKIAAKHRTTPALLRSVNKIRGNRIRAGKTLLVPLATRDLSQYASADVRLNNILKRKKRGTKTYHTVRNGDSIWDLSREYRVGMRELARWNGMAPTDPLRVGRKLVIWQNPDKGLRIAPSQHSLDSKRQKIRYTVRRGDSLARISQKFRIKTKDLIRWNNLDGVKYLQPGQKLTLYVNVLNQSS